jgi:GNAT superfamily N-acetyltransferase
VDVRLATWLADPAAAVLVADLDTTAVGVLALHAIPYFERPGKWGRIVALVVDQAQQGRGIGRRLVEQAHRVAAELGCTDMEVASSRHRLGAHAFYRRLGYEELCDRSGASCGRSP